MNGSDRAIRLALAMGVAGCLACGESRSDPHLFDAVAAAAESVRSDVGDHSRAGSAHIVERLRAFDAEIAAIEHHVRGRRDKTAMNAFAAGAEAYKYWLRYRDLDAGAAGDMILLRGANRPIAFRYGIPIEERGGGRWVNRKIALRMFAAKADAELNAAMQLVYAK
jgi:hypothetical protein